MRESLSRRRRRAFDAARQADCDVLLVSGPSNIRYLTGFTGSAGALLLTESDAVLATDGRYVEQAADESPGVRVETTRSYLTHLVEQATAAGATRVGAEADHLSWSQVQELQQLLAAAGPAHELLSTTDVVETLRVIKDDDEIALIRRACDITSQALMRTIGTLRLGDSERALARRFLDAATDLGADGAAFDPIVAIGANAARPHHQPGHTIAEPGDVVLFDVGAAFAGYCADLSRTVCMGPASQEIREVHALVEQAQQAGLDAIRGGATAGDVDAAAREVIRAGGYAEQFVHGTGHGLGIDIHEPPLLGRDSDDRLSESSTVTVEPGIYLPGVGGVRIEDTVLVTALGGEPLTTVPRALIEC